VFLEMSDWEESTALLMVGMFATDV